MSCPNANPTAPQLAYSWASFSANDYDNYRSRLRQLSQLGFRVLTLVPTYRVVTQPIAVTYQSGVQTKNYREIIAIEDTHTPVARIRAVVEFGIELGMHIRIVPHLDADIVFSSQAGEVYWRAQFLFDPTTALINSGSYFDVVLQPLMNLIVQVKDHQVVNFPNCRPCFSLTLGSELEMSVLGYPASWLQSLQNLQQQRATAQLGTRLDFGHKLNHDHASRLPTWIIEMNKINAAQNPPAPVFNQQVQIAAESAYLQQLDYLAFSFYPDLTNALTPPAQWAQEPASRITDGIASEFSRAFANGIRNPFAGLGVPIEIGEASIGTTKVGMPWQDQVDPNVNTPAGKNVRLNYILGLLQFIRQNASAFQRRPQRCFKFNPLSFWTAGRFDIFGLDYTTIHDARINNAVRVFNAANGCPIYIPIGGGEQTLFSGYFFDNRRSEELARIAVATDSRQEARQQFAAYTCPGQECRNKGLRNFQLTVHSIDNRRSWLMRFLNWFNFGSPLPTYYTDINSAWNAEVLCTQQEIPGEDGSLRTE